MMNKFSKIIIYSLMIFLSACASTTTGYNPTVDLTQAAKTNTQLGLRYMQSGRNDIAMEKLQKALKQNPQLPDVHNGLALLYQRLGENQKSEQEFIHAIQLKNNYSEAHNNYGVLLCEQKRYQESVEHFVLAAKDPIYRDRAASLENAGLCSLRDSKPAQAETYFKKALAINPNLPKSLLQMAKLMYNKANYLGAKAYIQRYQQSVAWTAETLLLAIKIANKLGEQDDIVSYTSILNDRFPSSKEAQLVNQGAIQ